MDIKGASCDQSISPIHESPSMRRRRNSSSASNDGFVCPPDPQYVAVDVCGNLHKQGKLLKTWKQRYFEIQGSFMYYYKSDQKKQYLGCVDLQKCYYVGPSSAATFGAPFELQTTGRTHLLAARNQQAVAQWVSVIKEKMLPEAKARTKRGSKADVSAYATAGSYGSHVRRATIKASKADRKAPNAQLSLYSVKESTSSHEISKTSTRPTSRSKVTASQSFPKISQKISMKELEECTEDEVFENKTTPPPTSVPTEPTVSTKPTVLTEPTVSTCPMETVAPSTMNSDTPPIVPKLNQGTDSLEDDTSSDDASLPVTSHTSLTDAHQLSTSLAIVEETAAAIQDTSVVSFDDMPLITDTPPPEPRAAFIKRLSQTMVSPPDITDDHVPQTDKTIQVAPPSPARGQESYSSSSTTSLSPSNRGYSEESYVERLREILAHDDGRDHTSYDELPPVDAPWEAQATSADQLRVFLRVCA